MRAPIVFARPGRAAAPVVALVMLVGVAVAFVTRPAAATQAADTTAQLSAALARLTGTGIPALPEASAFRAGPRVVAAAENATGPIAVSEGNTDIYGTVTGDVVTFHGDIVVHSGGVVTGTAVAIGGVVRLDGGQILGQSLELSGAPDGVAGQDAGTPGARIASRLALVGGWFTILLVISVGVLLLASENLAAVADALERHYGNALVAGVAGQLAFAPLLAAICVALVLSVLGILLVPFAAVAYVILTAGMVTLGFLATAVVIGRGWRAAPPGSDLAQRAATLRALVVGLVAMLSPWAAAAFLAPWPVAESLARGAAFAAIWVAGTAGLGATLISRAGIRRASSKYTQRAMASSSWQTPTPVVGVVAARRPSATPSAGAR